MDALDPVSEVVLERFQVASQNRISRQLIEDADVRSMWDLVVEQMIVELRTFVYANPAGRIVYSFPASPWQFWKSRHFPKWLLRRFPVREEAKAFSAAALFPEAALPSRPKHFGRAVFHVSEIPAG